MRIAFLTPEYPSEYFDGGQGLGTYVHRMASVLMQSGHEPEVFLPSRHSSQTFAHDGILVHRVTWKESQRLFRLLASIHKRSGRLRHWREVFDWMIRASALATTLERRHAEAPFSLVQSADYLATGLLVRRRPGRVHVIRCSSAADLYNTIDGTTKLERCRGYLERLSMRRADLAYAPSRYVAQHFIHTHRIDVQVIRPPKYLEIGNSSSTIPLPTRFFFHFGQLRERKGTALLAQALPLAWRTVPDLTMVWSGPCWDLQKLEHWRSLWRSGQADPYDGPAIKV